MRLNLSGIINIISSTDHPLTLEYTQSVRLRPGQYLTDLWTETQQGCFPKHQAAKKKETKERSQTPNKPRSAQSVVITVLRLRRFCCSHPIYVRENERLSISTNQLAIVQSSTKVACMRTAVPSNLRSACMRRLPFKGK